MALRRTALIAVLVSFALVALGARCLENESLRRDENGDWQIVGEIHNETDVQGLDMELLGVVEYEDGTVMQAEATMCPNTLSPGTFSAYRVTFEGSDAYIRPSASRVNVASGAASPDELPELAGAFEVNELLPDGPVAVGEGPRIGVAASFKLAESVIARPAVARARYSFCAILYGPGGDAIYMSDPTSSAVRVDPSAPGDRSLLMAERIRSAPVDAVEARLLFWLTTEDGTPTTAVQMTDLIPIVPRAPSDDF